MRPGSLLKKNWYKKKDGLSLGPVNADVIFVCAQRKKDGMGFQVSCPVTRGIHCRRRVGGVGMQPLSPWGLHHHNQHPVFCGSQLFHPPPLMCDASFLFADIPSFPTSPFWPSGESWPKRRQRCCPGPHIVFNRYYTTYGKHNTYLLLISGLM